jgi:hypothetical protein
VSARRTWPWLSACKACALGYRTAFVTAAGLIASLVKAHQESRLEEKLKLLVQPKLLIVDEIGYLPVDRLGANLFFQLVSRRYERGSILITSNQSLTGWGQVFGDQVIATAILDRLLHHSTIVNIKGESYRLKEKRKAGLLTRSEPYTAGATASRRNSSSATASSWRCADASAWGSSAASSASSSAVRSRIGGQGGRCTPAPATRSGAIRRGASGPSGKPSGSRQAPLSGEPKCEPSRRLRCFYRRCFGGKRWRKRNGDRTHPPHGIPYGTTVLRPSAGAPGEYTVH